MRTLLIALLLSAGWLGAQSGRTTLHADRPYHAAGDLARFALYLPLPAPATVRLEVFNPQGRLLDYFFLPVNPDGQASSYYRWDYGLTTGYYRLVISALAEDGTTADLGRFRLPVYNVADRDGPAVPRNATDPAEPTGLDLTVTDAGTVVAPDLPAGAYSLAVVSTSVLGPVASVVRRAPAGGAAGYRDTLFYRGRLRLADGDSPVATNLLPFFDVSTLATYFSKANSAGEFLLTVDPFSGSKPVQARSIGDRAVLARLEPRRLDVEEASPPLTPEVLNYLDLAYRRRKIYQLYGTVESPLTPAPDPPERRPLRADKTFYVPDYEAFPDLATFFREVAGELRVRQRREDYTALLYNAPNQRFFGKTPLFIVDGRLTRDVNYIMRISPADVERISFFYDNRPLRRDFPALGNHGVVLIDLLREPGPFPAVDAANIIPLQGLQPPARSTDPVAGAPRISPLLHWSTGRHAGGRFAVSLPPTDDPGDYSVILLLRESGSGTLRSGRTTHRVAASR